MKNLSGLNIDLKIMRNYLEVINQNSFTMASRILHVGQATISHQISLLEEALGVSLITRTSREFSVTAEGMLFKEFCERTLSDLDAYREKIKSVASGGSCVIAASSIPSVYILPEVIASLVVKEKKYFYKTLSGDTRECVEMVKEGRADIGLVGKEIKHPQLIFRKSAADEILLVGTEKFSDVLDPLKLASLPLISRETGSGTRSSFEAALPAIGLNYSDLNSVYECANSEAVKRSILAGLGAGYISINAVKDELADGRLKRIKVKGLRIVRNFYVVLKKNKPLNPAVQALESALT